MKEILQAQARRLRRLQALEARKALKITVDALKNVKDKLAGYLSPWDRATNSAVMNQLSIGIQDLAGKHTLNLGEVLPDFGKLSWNDTKDVLQHTDKLYNGSVRPLRFDALEWLENNTSQLSQVRLREYRKSFARYGQNAVEAVEQEIARSVLVGEPWTSARDKVWEAVKHAVGGRQWMVDRIIRTEQAAMYNGTRLAALVEEDTEDDPMMKRLVATFDEVTGEDSYMLDGQIQKVTDPFFDPYFNRYYMAPPNRPNDREIVVGWRASYGDAFEEPESTPTDASSSGISAAITLVGQERKRPSRGPVEKRQRTIKAHISAIDKELSGLAPDDPVHKSFTLNARKTALSAELSRLPAVKQQLSRMSVLTQSDIALLRRVKLGGRIRAYAGLETLRKRGLIRKRRTNNRWVFLLTAAGTAALLSVDRNEKTDEPVLTPR